MDERGGAHHPAGRTRQEPDHAAALLPQPGRAAHGGEGHGGRAHSPRVQAPGTVLESRLLSKSSSPGSCHSPRVQAPVTVLESRVLSDSEIRSFAPNSE